MDIKQGLTPQSQSHRMVYFSLVCPETVRNKIRGLQQWVFQRHGARAAMKSPAHITLIPPFWWPAEGLDALAAHAATFGFDPPKISVRLDGFGHFGKRVIFIRVEAPPQLQALQEEFSSYMRVTAGTAIKTDDRPFHPHVTIATRDLTPTAFREAWAHFSGVDFQENIELDTISLMLRSPGAWEIHRSFRWGS